MYRARASLLPQSGHGRCELTTSLLWGVLIASFAYKRSPGSKVPGLKRMIRLGFKKRFHAALKPFLYVEAGAGFGGYFVVPYYFERSEAAL